MLQGEAAATHAARSAKSSGDAFDRDITGGAFDLGHGGQHLAFAGGFEISVKLFVDGHAADGGVADFVVCGLRNELDVKWSAGVNRHGSSLLNWSGLRPRGRGRAEVDQRGDEGDIEDNGEAEGGARSLLHAALSSVPPRCVNRGCRWLLLSQ